MKQALIATNEPVYTGYRVAEVVADGATFPVSNELFWTPCADDIVADWYWYDPAGPTFEKDPNYWPPADGLLPGGGTVGTQTL